MEYLHEDARFVATLEGVSAKFKHLLEDILPVLLSTCEADHDRFVFVDGDIFSRNILISNSDPPTITGIIDFEFSGFLLRAKSLSKICRLIETLQIGRQKSTKYSSTNLKMRASLSSEVCPMAAGKQYKNCID